MNKKQNLVNNIDYVIILRLKRGELNELYFTPKLFDIEDLKLSI